MAKITDGLEPRLLWRHFEALSDIPHGSKNEAAVVEHILSEAHRMGLKAKKDDAGNVLVVKPGTRGLETAPVLVLQGHVDMVCEKNEGTLHDFAKDPIKLVRDGDFIRADGTTLGADNGIGVAAALAVLESDDLAHGPLECLFTVDEETGLTGAFSLDPGFLKGRHLLNLDTEEEGSIYVGCAGGMDSVATRRFGMEPLPPGHSAYRLKVAGLKGGHSGINIADGLGNAVKILARCLWAAIDQFKLKVVSIDGGSKRNAIPREAFAVFWMEQEREDDFREQMESIQRDIRAELGRVDTGLSIQVERLSKADRLIMADEDARHVVSFIYACPHGVISMSPDIPGLVQTSTNTAIVATKGAGVEVSMSHRSSVESAKNDVAAAVKAYCSLAGFEVTQSQGYPGWKPDLDSEVLRLAKAVHQNLFGREAEVKAVHAGLECGIIGEKFPGMDMISIGPNITGAHSHLEAVSIHSTGQFWKYLCALLKELAG